MFYAIKRALAFAAIIVIMKVFLPDVADELISIILRLLQIISSTLSSAESDIFSEPDF